MACIDAVLMAPAYQRPYMQQPRSGPLRSNPTPGICIDSTVSAQLQMAHFAGTFRAWTVPDAVPCCIQVTVLLQDPKHLSAVVSRDHGADCCADNTDKAQTCPELACHSALHLSPQALSMLLQVLCQQV